jgi:hypothetical protein
MAGMAGISALALGGCGGGGSSPGSGTAYAFVPPVLNSTRVYAEVIVDDANNTINVGFSQSVTAVNSDGTFGELETGTSTGSTIVNGTNYAIPDETQTYNANGQETAFTDLSVHPAEECAYDPHGDGPDWPLQVGQSWSIAFTLTCGSAAPVAYTQAGTVADVESVTVGAGTFTALKLQSTVTWTDAAGTTRTQTITNWRDVATSHSVKQEISIAVSGTPPAAGYAVSRSIQMESVS